MPNDKENGVDFSMILASSAHDIKNSVGMLLSTLEQLMQELPAQNHEQNRLYSSAQYESSRIHLELIQLLTLYRVKNTSLAVHVDQHYIIDVIEEQVARNQTLLDINAISIAVVCDASISCYIDGDLIGSVVHNILLNSIRYTDKHILIVVEENASDLVLRVEDDGVGYPKAMLDDAFEFNGSSASSVNSTQLGLYFAQCIAYEHAHNGQHGRISLSNNKSLCGGCFEMYLPKGC